MKSKAFNIALIITAIIVLILVGPRLYQWIFPPKITLQTTTITVADINDISRLYITQYYGEVINSWTEEKCKGEVENIFDLYTKIKENLNDPSVKEEIGTDDSKLLKHVKKTFLTDKDSEKRMDILLEVFVNAPLTKANLGRKSFSLFAKSRQNTERITLYKYIRDNDKDIYDQDHYEELIHEVRNKWGVDDKIAYLARGKVLLSIDLSSLEFGNFSVDKSGVLTIDTPLIIDVLINPNFIYGKSWDGKTVDFPGYVVILNTKKAARAETLEQVKKVKLGCKKKLILNALGQRDKDKSAPLTKALSEAETKLFSFFSLFKSISNADSKGEQSMNLANLKKVKINITEYKSDSSEIAFWVKHQATVMSQFWF